MGVFFCCMTISAWSGAVSAAAREPVLFQTRAYTFYADRLEAHDAYRGTYRTADGRTIRKDGDPAYTWSKARPDKLSLHTPYPILDAAYALAVSETLAMIAPAGTKSDQLDGDRPGGRYYYPYYYWTHGGKNVREYTRDSAQHIQWGDSVILDRAAAKGTLIRRCDFQGQTIRSDAVPTADNVHFIAALWEYYLITGDRNLLETCWPSAWNTLIAREKQFRQADGLWSGSPWSDSPYGFVDPRHFPVRNSEVQSLYANTMVAGAWDALGEIAETLGRPGQAAQCRSRSRAVKAAINARLYRPEQGTYGYYLFTPTGQCTDYREDISAGLIELCGVADARRTLHYHARFRETPYGYRNVDPVLRPDAMPAGLSAPRYAYDYHRGNVWENQEAFHGWAMARLGQAAELKKFIFWHARAGIPLKEWREGTVNTSTGEFHHAYKRLVWGAMGYASYWSRGVFGIVYQRDGLRFAPCVPEDFGDAFFAELSHFSYRRGELRLILLGKGTRLDAVVLDGRPVAKIPADVEGSHTVEIVMHAARPPAGLAPRQPLGPVEK
jgi:hypothetical protein